MNATSSHPPLFSSAASASASSSASSSASASSSKPSTFKRFAESETPTPTPTPHELPSTANSITIPSPLASNGTTPSKRGIKNKKPGNSGGVGAGGAVGATNKRRCVSNACIACRKRKSKCDGNLPSCAACASVYGTECVYDPSSDHRRKGVYKKDIDNLKTRNSTLQTLLQAILDYPEDQVAALVHAIRRSDNLEDVAEAIAEGGKHGSGLVAWPVGGRPDSHVNTDGSQGTRRSGIGQTWRNSDRDKDDFLFEDDRPSTPSGSQATFESELSNRMSRLRVDAGSGQVRFIGGTSNLILLPSNVKEESGGTSRATPPMEPTLRRSLSDPYASCPERNPILSWTRVTNEAKVVQHLINMYFAWHYPYFATLSRDLFFRDYYAGYSAPKDNTSNSPYPYSSPSPPFYNSSGSPPPKITTLPQPKYCTPLLVNALLALGCHFTSHPLARADPMNSNTAGDHFFQECKRLLLENDEHAAPRLATVQALSLMSVREAGCAREDSGWSYSGMSFRMGIEMGLHLELEEKCGNKFGEEGNRRKPAMSEEEIDTRRITFWGCYLIDKCWSNYMGRMPQLQSSIITVPRFIIIPSEDAGNWCPFTDVGESFTSRQPARTRAVALQISELCEISSDILTGFYNPNPNQDIQRQKASGSVTTLRPEQEQKAEIRKLGDLWNRLEDWRKKLPKELEGREGSLPPVLLMHMFHQLLYIHLFRPFLRFNPTTLLALTNLEPRKICVQAASTISKLLRFYKREYGLRQICNIAIYIVHSACTIHLLNLPAKTAKRDIVQGLRSLEDMAEGWLCARRALVIMRILAKRWKIELPDEAVVILTRTAKGQAEMFGLQTVVEEDAEDYLEYRGSSLSAVSTCESIDHNQPSPLLFSGYQQGSMNMLGMEVTMGGTEASPLPSHHSSPNMTPVPDLQPRTSATPDPFPTQPQLPPPLHRFNTNIEHSSTNQRLNHLGHQHRHHSQSDAPRQQRRSSTNRLPRQQLTINSSYAQPRYDNPYIALSNPSSAATPSTTATSQSFSTPMITTLSARTVTSSASEFPQHASHLSPHQNQQYQQHFYAAFNTPSPMDSQSSSASSPTSVANMPNVPTSMANAISVGYGGGGPTMSVDQWWLRDQFGVVEGWLGGASPGHDAVSISIGQEDSPPSTGHVGGGVNTDGFGLTQGF